MSTRPTAPDPEPNPFSYAIQASGDALAPPMYTITVSGGGCSASSTTEPIIVQYLDIGVNQDFVNIAPT